MAAFGQKRTFASQRCISLATRKPYMFLSSFEVGAGAIR
jgi:hypothetical protein